MENKKLIYYLSFCDKSSERIDLALSKILNISRNQIINSLEKKLIVLNNKYIKKNIKLSYQDEVKIFVLEKKVESKNSQLKIEIIYENEEYLILNKPSGLVVHSAPSVKEFTLCDYLKSNNYHLSNLAGEERMGIVHRLDKDTTGAILIAKNNVAHNKFANMLKDRTMGRIYICIINKALKEDVVVSTYIGRNPTNRIKMANLDPIKYKNARYAKTEFIKIMESKNFELIGAKLHTGRTHQIRVHLSSLNRFIYGDCVYSPNYLLKTYNTKILLHAALLYFDSCIFKAEIPNDFLNFLETHFLNYKEVLEFALDKQFKS